MAWGLRPSPRGPLWAYSTHAGAVEPWTGGTAYDGAVYYVPSGETLTLGDAEVRLDGGFVTVDTTDDRWTYRVERSPWEAPTLTPWPPTGLSRGDRAAHHAG